MNSISSLEWMNENILLMFSKALMWLKMLHLASSWRLVIISFLYYSENVKVLVAQLYLFVTPWTIAH